MTLTMIWRSVILATGGAPASVYHSAFGWFDALGAGSLLALTSY
jgi:hypothetical protein